MAKRPTKERAAEQPDAAPEAAPESSPPLTMLDQIIGQAQAKKTLTAAMQSGRVHHAWVFHGPTGVGKFSAAVAFAAALIDPTTAPGLAGDLSPEPDSQVQRLIRAGSHPDLHIVTKELARVSEDSDIRDRKQLNIPVQVIREFLIAPAGATRALPGDSRAAKAFIIDEAEIVDPRGQNTILKLLEEPPSGTVIILVTSQEERLLPTIRSRCQRVAFAPLDEKEMAQWLTGRPQAKALTKDQKHWLLKFASGSPGAAKVALDNDLFTWEEALRPGMDEIEKGRFPLGLAGTMAKLIDERAAAAVKSNPDASKDAANKAWARRMLAFLSEDVRARLRARSAGKSAERVEADPAAQRWLHAIDAITEAEGFLAANVNMGLLLENLVAQMSAEPAVA